MKKLWHTMDGGEIEGVLGTHMHKGLSKEQYENNKNQYGPNLLKEQKPKSFIRRFMDQLKDFMVMILLIACGISFVLGEITDAIIIVAVVILNATLGVIQESKAEKSLEALKKLIFSQCEGDTGRHSDGCTCRGTGAGRFGGAGCRGLYSCRYQIDGVCQSKG